MKSRRIEETPATFVLIFDSGDEVMQLLTGFAKQRHITGAHFSGIGAFDKAVLGYFDWQAKQYQRIPVNEQMEVLSISGDIALDQGEPKVHAHVIVGLRDGSTRGGHLLEANVRPTLEVVLTESPAKLRREMDPEAGIALIKL